MALIQKNEFLGEFLALLSLDTVGKCLGKRLSRRVMFLLRFSVNLELQFNYFSLRSVLRSDFELKFGSVWAGGSPFLLVPFSIS